MYDDVGMQLPKHDKYSFDEKCIVTLFSIQISLIDPQKLMLNYEMKPVKVFTICWLTF
jgi:hypothetical protein